MKNNPVQKLLNRSYKNNSVTRLSSLTRGWKLSFNVLYNNGFYPPHSLLHSRFSVVTQRWGGALRDDTKNGCVADYQLQVGVIPVFSRSQR